MKRMRLDAVARIEAARPVRPEALADAGIPILRGGRGGRAPGRGAFVALEHAGDHATVDAGELVVSLTAIEEGARVVADAEAGCVLAHPLVRIRAAPGAAVSLEWLHVWMASSDFQQQAAARGRGVGHGRLSVGDLRDLTLPVPENSEQAETAASLRPVIRAVELAEAQLDRLRRLLRVEADLALADGQ